jgi:hypothetical protein
MSQLLRAVSATDLIAYFEFLDDRRMPSAAGAQLALTNRYPGMARNYQPRPARRRSGA